MLQNVSSLELNWQETRSDFDYKTNHLCPHLAMNLSTKPADGLCQQIDDRNRAEFAWIKSYSQSVFNLPIIQDFINGEFGIYVLIPL